MTSHEKWNNEMARQYDPDSFITKSGILIRSIEGYRLALTKKLLNATQQSHILDVGCGSGNLLEILEGEKLVGLDLSDFLLEQAKKRLSSRHHISIHKGDAEHLPFNDHSFDRLVCSEVLEHVEHPDQVLTEIHRVAKQGARIVLTFPNEDLINLTKRIIIKLNIKNWISKNYNMSDNMLDQWHVNEISPEWVVNNAKTKFRLISRRRVPFPLLTYHHLLCFERI